MQSGQSPKCGLQTAGFYGMSKVTMDYGLWVMDSKLRTVDSSTISAVVLQIEVPSIFI